MSWLRDRRDARLRRAFGDQLQEMVSAAMVDAGQWRSPTTADRSRGFLCPACHRPVADYDKEAGIVSCKAGHLWTNLGEYLEQQAAG